MLNFQEMIAKLTQFWANQGCIVHQGYDLEVGAGTFNPATFLRCLGPEPYAAVYVEPSRRPKDGRYGENPNRVQAYFQMQVIIKPAPPNIQELYLQSLEEIGLSLKEHDIRFVHDDWENPTIGAWGLGWEVWADGMEVTQFTYFQSVGGLEVKPVSGEITYGLERLAMYIQKVHSLFDLRWNGKLKYGDIYKRSEKEWSHYNFEEANTAMWFRHFDDFEAEAKRLIEKSLPIPAYDFVMKASHAFNILDARGVISVTERTGYIGRIRALASAVAHAYTKSREEQSFPLLKLVTPPKLPETPARLSEKFDPEQKEDFLLEIGSEELPATSVPIGANNLKRLMETFLKVNSLSHGGVAVYGTPRRLAVYVKDLAAGTLAQRIERKGPPLSAAFNTDGNLTTVGSGFFRALNLPAPPKLKEIEKGKIPEIEIRTIKEIPYIFATLNLPGESTRALLQEELPKMILNIEFPKKMRWGDLDISYARPLSWLLALYGKEEIPFVLGYLQSGKTSFGHRLLSPGPISISHPRDYLDKLRSHHVLADIEERKESILQQMQKMEKEVKGTLVAQEKVLPQVLHLVEWPLLTAATFDPAFLRAPKEVLISEMVEHQKYFPVADSDGALKPQFVIVCNTHPTDLIREGNQNALSPRLADGVFLYEEDLKISLETFIEKLRHITFQKELGSVYKKVERLVSNVAILHSYLPIADLEKAKRAAFLCKGDLASGLVGEFPELQGIAGKIYAEKHSEPEEIAHAIEEHWRPRGEKAPLPETPMGVLVALAEKIDNILSCFSLGLVPTSSSDPYALKRQGSAICKMLIEGKYHLPLRGLLSRCFESFLEKTDLSSKQRQKISDEQAKILNEIMEFLTGRLRTLLTEYGFGKDEIEATLSRGLTDVYSAYRLISSLHQFRKQFPDDFAAILEIDTRVRKILISQNADLVPVRVAEAVSRSGTDQRFPPVSPVLFRDSLEKSLFEKIEEIKNAFHSSLVDRRTSERHDYEAAFRLLGTLRLSVSEFFEKVKVLENEDEVRHNRLSLLQEIWDLCEELVDWSKIQILEK